MKMRLLCFLMALALANVLASTELEYKTQVYTTNFYFQTISADESKVDLSIETLICSDLPITWLCYKLVVPESISEAFDYDYISPYYVDDEKEIQKRLTSDHNIQEIPDTTPDHISNMTWPDLGKNRRSIINPSFLRLLNKDESESPTGLNDEHKCRLAGLYVNGIFPKYSIIESEIDVHDGHHDCHLTDNLCRKSIFRKFDDGFWKVKNDYSQYYKLTDPNVKQIMHLEEYKIQVYSTNHYFGLISADESKLDVLIETLIRSDTSIERLGLMLVVPESMVTNNVRDFILPENEDDERTTQLRIMDDFRIQEIQYLPDITPDHMSTMTWDDLGKNRRNITKPSLLRLLKKVESESQTELSNDQKCVLVGLYVNGRDPKKRIVASETVVHDRQPHCQLTDNLNFVSIFRKFGDGFWKLKDDYTQDHKLIGRNLDNCDIM